MADDHRTFQTSTPAANRAETQGLGVGQKELNAQQAPRRDQSATDPQRLEPFHEVEPSSVQGRDAASVDIHNFGEDENPEQEWGDEATEGHSANHSRGMIKTEAERGQGAKTRAATKDIISRRR